MRELGSRGYGAKRNHEEKRKKKILKIVYYNFLFRRWNIKMVIITWKIEDKKKQMKSWKIFKF